MAEIYKAYDIRGIYPEEIDEDIAFKLGRAFIEFLRGKNWLKTSKVVIGRDCRMSSPELADSLMSSIIASGIDVIDIGQCSTPMLYWSIINEKADGGIMVTASHNPPEHNGFKVCGPDAVAIGLANGLAEIKALVQKEWPMGANAGKVGQKNVLADYVKFARAKFNLNKIKPFKIIVDSGNGVAGPEVKRLLELLNCETEYLFFEPNGNFPFHAPNPSDPDNLRELEDAVFKNEADLGVALDGDGDRIVFITEKGESVRGDYITAIIGRELLKKNPGQKIYYEVRSSRIVPELIKEAGGQPVLGRPGHSLIKEQMRKENILFGGELSGHYFYSELGFIENVFYTLLTVLTFLSEDRRPFSQIVKPLQKYFASGEINVRVPDADKKLEEVENYFKDAQIKKVDGITVEFPDWWFNLRKSNTEPLVRLNIEADNMDTLMAKKEEILGILEK